MQHTTCQKPFGLLAGLLLALHGLLLPATAQVYTRQIPAGMTLNRMGVLGEQTAMPAMTLPAVDAAPLLAEDGQRSQKGLPLRMGVSLSAPADLMQAAPSVDRAGYRVHSCQINVPGAVATSLVFDQLQLTAGARVFIYSTDRTMLFGPITGEQNGTRFATDFLPGAAVIVEVQEPAEAAGQSIVRLAEAVHGYRTVTGPDKAFGTVGGSGACEVNMVCQPAYQPEGDGVALVLASYGGYTYVCTGSMINSTRQDFRSYFLTAFHCVDFNGDGTLSSGEVDTYATAQFRFNWQSPTCTPSQADPMYITLSGAALKAARRQSDFSLFEFNSQPPPAENLTYLGWNRGRENATSVACIHHPLGDVKKITFGGSTVVSGYGTDGNDHLTAYWSAGVTEGGSSGSPLLDQNRRIIGQLHGGPSYCGAPAPALRDFYGRFYTSWDAGGTAGTQLKDFLDPDRSGALTTNGVKATLSGPESFTGTTTVALNTGAGTTVTWTVTDGSSAVMTTSGTGNVATLTASPTAGNTPVTVVFTVNAGQSYPLQFSRTIRATTGTASPQTFAFLPPAYDCGTGAITFRTTTGNGATIEYRAVGVTDWTTNPNAVVDAPVRGDGQALTLMARQSGVVVESPFDFRAYCAGQIPPTNPTEPTTLQLLPPVYDCGTGAITFRTTTGNGATIEYRAVGVTDWTTNPNAVVDAPVRGDGQALTLMARQSGVVVESPFDFRAYCRAVQARVGVDGLVDGTLDVLVLGNPGRSVIRAEARGAAGLSLHWQLIDLNGRIVEERRTAEADSVDQQTFTLKAPSVSVLLLRVSSPGQTKTVRVIAAE